MKQREEFRIVISRQKNGVWGLDLIFKNGPARKLNGCVIGVITHTSNLSIKDILALSKEY